MPLARLNVSTILMARKFDIIILCVNDDLSLVSRVASKVIDKHCLLILELDGGEIFFCLLRLNMY